MTYKALIIHTNDTLENIKIENDDLESIKQLLNNNNIHHLIEWNSENDLDDIIAYGSYKGEVKNKHSFLPPLNDFEIYGDVLILKKHKSQLSNITVKDYKNLFTQYDVVDDDDSDSDYIPSSSDDSEDFTESENDSDFEDEKEYSGSEDESE